MLLSCKAIFIWQYDQRCEENRLTTWPLCSQSILYILFISTHHVVQKNLGYYTLKMDATCSECCSPRHSNSVWIVTPELFQYRGKGAIEILPHTHIHAGKIIDKVDWWIYMTDTHFHIIWNILVTQKYTDIILWCHVVPYAVP